MRKSESLRELTEEKEDFFSLSGEEPHIMIWLYFLGTYTTYIERTFRACRALAKRNLAKYIDGKSFLVEKYIITEQGRLCIESVPPESLIQFMSDLYQEMPSNSDWKSIWEKVSELILPKVSLEALPIFLCSNCIPIRELARKRYEEEKDGRVK